MYMTVKNKPAIPQNRNKNDDNILLASFFRNFSVSLIKIPEIF